jgi:hypothetical protein
MNTPYQAPKHPLMVLQSLNFDEVIEPTDPRFVDTDAGRGGEGTQRRLAIKFGLDPDTQSFYPVTQKHVLLFGPIGAGKSTEIRRFAATLKQGQKLHPILLNVRGEIDINNLQYSDMLMALAFAVVKDLESQDIALDDSGLEKMRAWFSEQIMTSEKIKDIAVELRSEIEVGLRIPLLAKLMAKFTPTFKNSSIHKTTLREVVQNSFTQFADAFNELLSAAEQAINAEGIAQRIVLLVDGTDKATTADAQRLFVSDAEQLLAIRALVLYTAPIALKYGGTTHGKLDSDLVLPIIKLIERNGTRNADGWQTMRDILGLRIDLGAFINDEAIELLIRNSGGHPREMLRLLQLACEITTSATISVPTVEKAVAKLAADFGYWLQPEDYKVLAEIDFHQGANVGNDERVRNLLWRLALLHYNDGSWRATHPVLLGLEGYRLALAQLSAAAQP